MIQQETKKINKFCVGLAFLFCVGLVLLLPKITEAVSVTGNLISSIFDTGVSSGVAINTIMWQGNKPSGTNVKFQIASSNNSSGPWSYLGPDGSDTTYYTPTDANMPVQINLAHHNNKRYFRYKIFLESNASQTESPRVDDVIINWSP